MTKSSFSLYEPKIHQNYPKLCLEGELRHSWLFQVKSFFKNFKFFEPFCRSGVMKFFRKAKSLFSLYEPKIHRNYPKWCLERELRYSWLFQVKKSFLEISNFLNFFVGPGSLNISEMAKSSFSLYEPKIHRNYPK